MLRKHEVIKLVNFKSTFDTTEGKKLGAFALMAITSAATVPVSHLIIRNYIGETLSWDDAGYWQAIWYISTMYLMVVTTTLSIYYLPKLSEITDKAELREELLHGYKIIMPIVIVLSVSVYLLKDFIIWLLFTEDFAPVRDLFLWQLVGDVLKLAAWLVAYLMLAKAMTKTFIITEVAFSLSFVLLSIWFVGQYGLVGMSYSFAINYGLYFIAMIFATKKEWGEG
jgi:PST family polysaccharide transporter